MPIPLDKPGNARKIDLLSAWMGRKPGETLFREPAAAVSRWGSPGILAPERPA